MIEDINDSEPSPKRKRVIPLRTCNRRLSRDARKVSKSSEAGYSKLVTQIMKLNRRLAVHHGATIIHGIIPPVMPGTNTNDSRIPMPRKRYLQDADGKPIAPDASHATIVYDAVTPNRLEQHFSLFVHGNPHSTIDIILGRDTKSHDYYGDNENESDCESDNERTKRKRVTWVPNIFTVGNFSGTPHRTGRDIVPRKRRTRIERETGWPASMYTTLRGDEPVVTNPELPPVSDESVSTERAGIEEPKVPVSGMTITDLSDVEYVLFEHPYFMYDRGITSDDVCRRYAKVAALQKPVESSAQTSDPPTTSPPTLHPQPSVQSDVKSENHTSERTRPMRRPVKLEPQETQTNYSRGDQQSPRVIGGNTKIDVTGSDDDCNEYEEDTGVNVHEIEHNFLQAMQMLARGSNPANESPANTSLNSLISMRSCSVNNSRDDDDRTESDYSSSSSESDSDEYESSNEQTCNDSHDILRGDEYDYQEFWGRGNGSI